MAHKRFGRYEVPQPPGMPDATVRLATFAAATSVSMTP